MAFGKKKQQAPQQQGQGGYDPYFMEDDFMMGSGGAPMPQQQMMQQPPQNAKKQRRKKAKRPKKVQSATERVKSLSRLTAICAGFAVIGMGIGIWGTFNGQNIANEAKSNPKSIVVASTDLPRGAEITADTVKEVEVPQPYRSSAAVPWESRDLIIGKRTATAVASGTQVTTDDVQGTDSQSSLSQSIDEGHEAVTISVDSVSGMSNLIKIGDLVRVVKIDPDAFAPQDIVVARVIALGNSLYDLTEGEYGTITVDVTPEQANQIRLAQNSGSTVTCILEPYSKTDLFTDRSNPSQQSSNNNGLADQFLK